MEIRAPQLPAPQQRHRRTRRTAAELRPRILTDLSDSPSITDAERNLVALYFGDLIRQILSEKE